MGINMTHIESRPSKKNPGLEYDFYIDCEVPKDIMENLFQRLKTTTDGVSVHARSPGKEECKLSILYFSLILNHRSLVPSTCA